MLLKIEPRELKFIVEPKKQLTSNLYLSNVTENLVAFRFLTTNIANGFKVKPETGIILPHSTCDITVTTKENHAPFCMQSKDVTRIQCVGLKKTTQLPITEKEDMMKQKMWRHFIVGDKEDDYLPVVYLSHPNCRTPSPDQNELLNIETVDFTRRLDSNKAASFSIRMSNESDEHYVGFKVKEIHGANKKKFDIRFEPSRGVVSPRSKRNVIVTVQLVPESNLPGEKCEERFRIRSAVMKPGTLEEDVDWEMWNIAGVRVKESKVFYITYITNKIQRCLRRVSSAFDKMWNSLGRVISSRLCIISQDSLSSSLYQRPLDEAD
ncbi:OLC1v1031962C1 [Oldenlandia corymbosa var. corymbosa]|uniref:OLC1v1031962C1 n=1 Tax=Oldenlandia corymbosa var. corymbosa TaxID=529605 RepID=A0AAV1CJV3_OLDCO|nr:OLC1v1031962C1 [Oldenlandia corymbosa var. corymbosa]